MDLRETLEGAILEYNKYRSPEAEANLVSISMEEFKIEFRGSFCYTCSFYDYIEDYRVILEDMGLSTVISSIEETEEGAIVTFKVLGGQT